MTVNENNKYKNVKERDNMAEKVYEITLGKIRELQEELERRKTKTAAEISERLKEARALGDLSENAEYDAAKEAQANNEVAIMEIEAILKNAKVIDAKDISRTRVSLGGKVALRREDTGEEYEYMIVSEKEEDIFKNKVSSDSPIGQALLGHKKDDQIEVTAPAGIFKYTILKISKADEID